MKITTTLSVAALLLGFTSAAYAVPIPANGSFTIIPVIGAGLTTVNTGHITLGTSSKTDPDMVVQAATPNLTLAINPGDAANFSSHTRLVPGGVGTTVPVDFSLTVSGIIFDFDTGVTNERTALNPGLGTAGSFAEQFSGTLANGNGIFETDTPVTLSETCTQSVVGHKAGLISCTNSVITIGTPVPEPTSLALLGSALFGAGILINRRRKTS